jgi:hypothetical protein
MRSRDSVHAKSTQACRQLTPAAQNLTDSRIKQSRAVHPPRLACHVTEGSKQRRALVLLSLSFFLSLDALGRLRMVHAASNVCGVNLKPTADTSVLARRTHGRGDACTCTECARHVWRGMARIRPCIMSPLRIAHAHGSEIDAWIAV